jgi:hypothetical protein
MSISILKTFFASNFLPPCQPHELADLSASKYLRHVTQIISARILFSHAFGTGYKKQG